MTSARHNFQFFPVLAREPEGVQQEAAHQFAVRDAMGAKTSVVAYGLQALILRDYVADSILLGWVLFLVFIDLVNIKLSKPLIQAATDPGLRRRTLRWLGVIVFCAGSSWGSVALMPGLNAHPEMYMFNVLFLVVVGMISSQNLCLYWPALTSFTVGLMWPVVVASQINPPQLSSTLLIVACGLLVMVQLYGRTTRQVFLAGMQARLASEVMAVELRQKNVALTNALTVIKQMADLDPLTQCMNRRAVMRELQGPSRERRFGGSFGIILLDVDHFKQINDSHGHGIGDAVLVAAAERLRGQLRAQDMLGRWGGEEFLCVMSDVDAEGMRSMAERLRVALSETAMLPPPHAFKVTASFGLALCRSDDSLDDAIDRADRAMYRAKRSGRNRIEI